MKISRLRAQLRELADVVRQLQQARRDNAAAQLLLSRKRAELEDALTRGG
jgi:hypothetical protein